MNDATAATKGTPLLTMAKLMGGTPKLLSKTYNNKDEVAEAGDAAFECGQHCQSFVDVDQFWPFVDGKIGVTVTVPPLDTRSNATTKVEGNGFLTNKLLLGYLQNVTSEKDLVKVTRNIKLDDSWSTELEKELVIKAVSLLVTERSIIDFMYALKTQPAKDSFVALLALRGKKLQEAH